MHRRRHLSRRQRLLWIVATLFCLLFQQQVMAAYVCTTAQVAGVGTPMTGDCAQMMPGHAAKVAHQNADPRCAEHCASHASAQADARVPMVPPLLLPPASPLLLGTVALSPEKRSLPDPLLQPPEAPPSLRFCSLLI
ncbi:hypothetical protein [Dyella sp. GSA-30]|uniref:hypothetical protein n=1 Tax=Dyella sp. GSA-30 TaxID=2994496 RepID=UPI0024903A7F|nr:hypothetical protein [Dyella sp. GSA-30]BDU22569.1 hypothetical protein DYGSA30_40260 [Dyella sp. GSA-30]